MKKNYLLFLICLLSTVIYAQRAKDGAATISAAGTQVNAYTVLTADAIIGNTSITVADNTLSTNFSANLTAGDLIFIYQAQGATIDGVPNSASWGQILTYNNAGNYEFAEVIGVTDGTGVTLTCGLQNDYTSADHVQIVRVPRYDTLMVNSGASITCPTWNGTTGGLVVVESNGDTTIDGSIDTSGTGFRGGQLDPSSTFSADWVSTNPDSGAEKGESIGGSQSDYDGLNGKYCRAAPANGGGGGNAHNCGGGGGANSAPIGLTWSGFGEVDPTYNTSWNLEAGWLPNHSRAGGGKGGYGHSGSNQDATLVGPNNSLWGGDWRRSYGGQGGRILDYTSGKIFFGGGGGAGDQNNADGGAGGNGGGIVFVSSYGNVSGSGSIISNGNDGGDTDDSNPPFGGLAGNDGAGGAGGGGTVIINTNGITSGVTLNANGGKGGDQLLAPGAFGSVTEAEGPGGGGGGGYIAVSGGTPTRTTNGGLNGITNSPHLIEFPPNGASRGSLGRNNASIDNYYPTATENTTCVGNSTSLTASITGTSPAGTTIGWYDAEVGGTLLGTGTTYSPGILGSDTTYYVGLCPGYYRIPINVTISPLDDSSFNFVSASYAVDDVDPTPTITGLGGGTFTSLPAGLDIDPSSGLIDVSESIIQSYTVTYTTEGPCPDSQDVAVEITSSLGINDENLSKNLELYPNPNKGLFSIMYSGKDLLEQLNVYDVTGKHIKIINMSNFNNTQEYDISYLSKGMYFIIIKTANATTIKKMLLQ